MDKNDILISLSESQMTKVGKEEFAHQSQPQKVFTAIWEVESEVNNGGFAQYFLNESAESAAFLVEALETIGAPQTASICRRAIAFAFPDGLPSAVEAIQSAARHLAPEILAALEPLDEEFFSYPHNLTDLLFAYVSLHPEEFGTRQNPTAGSFLVRLLGSREQCGSLALRKKIKDWLYRSPESAYDSAERSA